MKRIKQLFEDQNRKILSIYFTAGYPSLNSTITIMNELQQSGVDMIEVGMPYSDPLADGPVIQSSSANAIANGMTIEVLFEQLKGFRNNITIPVILMGYLNPVLQYGFDKFCADAATTGIDGVIIPDLPLLEYKKNYHHITAKHGLAFVFLVTPETSEERIKKLDELGSGFIYAVTSSSVTGSPKNFTEVESYLSKLKSYKLRNPVLAGFGVSNKTTIDQLGKHCAGVIIGSSYIKALIKEKNVEAATANFFNELHNN
jgi:tryptophan synthase alpha chain